MIVPYTSFMTSLLTHMDSQWTNYDKIVLEAYLLPLHPSLGMLACLCSYVDYGILFACTGTRAVSESDDLVAWDTQATVPLPDIHAKNNS